MSATEAVMNEIEAWLGGRIPAEWFEAAPTVTVDREEISVHGRLPEPEDLAADAEPHVKAAAEAGRIARFREQTREARIGIAREAEHRFGRSIAWGAASGATSETFTSLAVPVMTRLRQSERRVLDTLVDAGVARSRSHALAWCVRLVGEHTEDWLEQLRSALRDVERLRGESPTGG
jgi:hypothetical protein